jgi:electron transport complex protein RnfD
MEVNLISSASPHIHSGSSSRLIMADVIIALLPAAVASVILFGTYALWMILVCIASAVVSEFVFNAVTAKEQTLVDLSAVVTGLLLALNLSTNVALWQGALGACFAIIVVKCLFGGMGHNFANPAITARVFLLLAFSSVAGGANPIINAGVDAVSSATPLELIAQGSIDVLPSLKDMFLGLRGGTIGETCILALLVGYVYLVARKVIKWYIPAIFVCTVFVCSWIITGSLNLALYEILSGGLILGAVFMATDYVTTPIHAGGRMLFALGCGLITVAIRFVFSYPEGVSFSILFMNILTPWIEKLTRNRPLGGV